MTACCTPVPTSHLGAGALAGEINAIVEDRAGAIWIGTFGGVLRYDPQAKAFDHLTHRADDPSSLSSNAVSAVVESAGRLWIGTYGAGLNEVDRQSGRVVQYRQQAGDAARLCGDYIWDLTPSRGVRCGSRPAPGSAVWTAGDFTSTVCPHRKPSR